MTNEFDPYYKWLGIPPSEQPPHHYRLLGIPLFESDREVIRNAADQKMTYLKSFGTGQHGNLSETLLNEVSAAKVCLLKDATKHAYDDQLRSRMSTSSPNGQDELKQRPDATSAPKSDSPPVVIVDATPSRTAPTRGRSIRVRKWVLGLAVTSALGWSIVGAVYFLSNNGTIKVDVDSPGLAVYHEFNIEPGTNEPIHITTGSVKIDVADPSLDVFLDGENIQTGKDTLLVVGDHQLDAKYGDVDIETRTLTVRQGEQYHIGLGLDELPAAFVFQGDRLGFNVDSNGAQGMGTNLKYVVVDGFPPNATLDQDSGRFALEPTLEDVGRYAVIAKAVQNMDAETKIHIDIFRFDLRVSSLSRSNHRDVSYDIKAARTENAHKIDLRNKGLSQISRHIGHLKELKSLDVSDNTITELPAQIGWLRKLEECDASGNVLQQISVMIGYFQELRVCDLSFNGLTTLPNEIGSLPDLEYLNLSNNHLTGLPRHISHCRKLQILDVRNNPLSPSEIDRLKPRLPNTKILSSWLHSADGEESEK